MEAADESDGAVVAQMEGQEQIEEEEEEVGIITKN